MINLKKGLVHVTAALLVTVPTAGFLGAHSVSAAGVASGSVSIIDDNGNPLTTTLLDYALPSAAEFPSFDVHSTETQTPLNPLGAKGIGESGTIGSTPAVQSAVVDALSHLGVRHVDMPCTAQKVWQAITAAQG